MNRFKNILYVFEQSAGQKAAIERAVSLAQNNQARLTVIDVIPEINAGFRMPPGGPVSAELTDIRKQDRQKLMKSLVAPYRDQLDIHMAVLVGRKFIQVIRCVLRDHHDLVIKPAEDPEWLDRLFGSDDMHLLRKCPCPLWLTRTQEKSNYETILAAIDFDPNDADADEQALNEAILQLASSIALSNFADLHLAHV